MINAINVMLDKLNEIQEKGVYNVSKSLDYELKSEQLNALIFLYLSGVKMNEIETLLTDINYHTLLKELKDFNDFIIDYFAE